MRSIVQRCLILVLFAACISTSSLVAQSSPGPRLGLSSPVAHRAALPSSVSNDSVPASQWKKGMIIGAGAGVLASAFLYELGRGLSDESTSGFNPLGLVLVVGVFSLLGGLIGSAFR